MEWIGSLAAVMTTGAFIPQAVKTIKSKDTSGISLGMYIIMIIGASLWIGYGRLTGDKPIQVGNSITLLFLIPILYLKLSENKKKN